MASTGVAPIPALNRTTGPSLGPTVKLPPGALTSRMSPTRTRLCKNFIGEFRISEHHASDFPAHSRLESDGMLCLLGRLTFSGFHDPAALARPRLICG